MTNSQQEASTSSMKLPSRRTYLIALSTVAFVSGLGIATVITIRRGRRMRLEELQGRRPSNLPLGDLRDSSTQQILLEKDGTVLGQASARGPMTLFREMNRAAFGRNSVNQPSKEHVSKARGTAVKASVFDSSASLAPPSSLMRASAKAKAAEITAQEQMKEPKSQRRAPFDKAVSKEESGDSPVILAVKAIGIATGLVGVGAYVAWEVARRLLGVRDIDELIDKLATAVPSKARNKHALAGFGGTARASLKQQKNFDEEDAMSAEIHTEEVAGAPLPVHEALQALDEAASRGEVSRWMDILSRQLNAEREQDLEQRRQRRAKQHRNVVQSPIVV